VTAARPVLITGASTGIGAATAVHLAGRGFEVFAGVRRPEDGDRLRERARVTPLILDVTDGDAIAEARAQLGEATDGALAGLVNNAGVVVSGPAEFLPLDEWRRQLEINLLGHVAVIQAFLGPLREARGRIVNVGSVGARTPLPFLGPYAASKAALAAMSDSLRRELRPWRIHVATVEPGSIATPIWEKGTSAAERMVEALPAEGRELYGGPLARMSEISERVSRGAIPPERVARVIERILTARRPPTRCLIGREAKLQFVVSRLLPDRAFDGLVARQLGVS
jgi:NAD(P)-dependent dehydrogenase (short-subunit alcohol dehydrogenase family)